jgi:hypothetical protein
VLGGDDFFEDVVKASGNAQYSTASEPIRPLLPVTRIFIRLNLLLCSFLKMNEQFWFLDPDDSTLKLVKILRL